MMWLINFLINGHTVYGLKQIDSNTVLIFVTKSTAIKSLTLTSDLFLWFQQVDFDSYKELILRPIL